MNTIHFPALKELLEIQSDHDVYVIIDNPVTGNAVKISLENLKTYLTSLITLEDLSDVADYTNNTYLTIVGGVPYYTLFNSTAKSLIALSLAANPNCPAAIKGDRYIVTAAGKFGGAFFGQYCNVGTILECTADVATGAWNTVGSSWTIRDETQSEPVSVNFAASPYTVLESVDKIIVDCTAGNVSLVFPALGNIRPTKEITVIKIDASGNTVDMTVSGGTTINGAATSQLTAQWESSRIWTNGTLYYRT